MSKFMSNESSHVVKVGEWKSAIRINKFLLQKFRKSRVLMLKPGIFKMQLQNQLRTC